jgi:hypothetical protein
MTIQINFKEEDLANLIWCSWKLDGDYGCSDSEKARYILDFLDTHKIIATDKLTDLLKERFSLPDMVLFNLWKERELGDDHKQLIENQKHIVKAIERIINKLMYHWNDSDNCERSMQCAKEDLDKVKL